MKVTVTRTAQREFTLEGVIRLEASVCPVKGKLMLLLALETPEGKTSSHAVSAVVVD
jgi:hypothetical protein